MPDDLMPGWLTSSPPDISTLQVPFDYPPNKEDEAVIYCIWMVNHYVNNHHPNKKIRKATNGLSTDEILEEMTIVEGGWKPSQDELTVVGEMTTTLQFSLETDQDGSSDLLTDWVSDHLSRDLPLIVYVNGMSLKKRRRNYDGVHPVVVAGSGDGYFAIHDPWGDPEHLEKIENLEDAWDSMFNQLIGVSLSKKATNMVTDE